jgi:peptidoglycan/LPS O-acetylase OafA/YrhL
VENPLHPSTYFLFLQNIVRASSSPLYHYLVSPTWSLAVEEQFYLVAPFLIRYLSLRRVTQVLFACVLLKGFSVMVLSLFCLTVSISPTSSCRVVPIRSRWEC